MKNKLKKIQSYLCKVDFLELNTSQQESLEKAIEARVLSDRPNFSGNSKKIEFPGFEFCEKEFNWSVEVFGTVEKYSDYGADSDGNRGVTRYEIKIEGWEVYDENEILLTDELPIGLVMAIWAYVDKYDFEIRDFE